MARHEQVGVEPAPTVIAAYVAEVAAVNADQVEDPEPDLHRPGTGAATDRHRRDADPGACPGRHAGVPAPVAPTAWSR